METFVVGSLHAGPGTKVTGFLDIPGTPIPMPVTLVRGGRFAMS